MTAVWAHRGASAYAPENTMEAFRLAQKMGADGIELDVHLTRDGEILVTHDENVRRVTGVDAQVSSLTLAEAQALDACNGNLSKAAEQLGVARSTLYRRLRKFGIIE